MARMHHARRAAGGFTLLEILVVIGILAILSGFLLGAIAHVRQSEFEAASHAELSSIVTALTEYRAEWGYYPAPGHADDEDPSTDGRLYRALYRRDVNPTGQLVTWEPTQLGVLDGDHYRVANFAELQDPKACVVLLDQHQRPYHYRERETHATSTSRCLAYELWCEGMNRQDDGGTGDDLVERH